MGLWGKLTGDKKQPKTQPPLGGIRCDICSKPSKREDCFILTTKEVVGSGEYWTRQLAKYESTVRHLPSKQAKTDFLMDRVIELALNPSGWLVCTACASVFQFNRSEAKRCATKQIERRGCGPAKTGSFSDQVVPAITAIVERP